MKQHRVYKNIISILLALNLIGAVGIVTAFASPEDYLPEADPSAVVEATAAPMPDAGVSDATLVSGIVMWLCVALGIAVLVGVLASKRTRRRR